MVSKLAREYVTVILSGDGGDELFAGYTRYIIDQERSNFSRIPSIVRKRMMQPLSTHLPHASRILDGQFELPGWQGASFSWPIDWHLEPLSNKQSPLIHWSKLDYLDAELAGDKKILWELNRHQYFLTLGQAYLLTKDERYAETFVAHLESWMNQNPPKQGIKTMD